MPNQRFSRAIAIRDFAEDFKPPFRETRLLGHAPSQNANRASRQNSHDDRHRSVTAGRVHPARSGARVVGIVQQVAQRAHDLEMRHHAPGGAGIDQAIAGSRTSLGPAASCEANPVTRMYELTARRLCRVTSEIDGVAISSSGVPSSSSRPREDCAVTLRTKAWGSAARASSSTPRMRAALRFRNRKLFGPAW